MQNNRNTLYTYVWKIVVFNYLILNQNVPFFKLLFCTVSIWRHIVIGWFTHSNVVLRRIAQAVGAPTEFMKASASSLWIFHSNTTAVDLLFTFDAFTSLLL